MEKTFAERYAATGDHTYAARIAGYSQPAVGAHRNLNDAQVMAEVTRIQTARLVNEALPLAVDHLIACVTNETAPWNARNGAAKIIIDRTLGVQDATQGKEPHEMTGDELSKAIEHMQRLKAEKARPVIEHDTQSGGVFE